MQGKALNVKKITKMYDFVHLSAGDLLRQERKTPGSKYGDLIEKHITEGSIVPVAITCSLLKREMENSTVRNFLIDGFPRNQDNFEGWNEAMSGVANVRRVLFFSCTDQVCVDRCLNRGITSGRTDDNEESLKKRLKTYRESSMPIIDLFKTMSLVTEIDGSVPAEEVFEEVKTVFTGLGFKAS